MADYNKNHEVIEGIVEKLSVERGYVDYATIIKTCQRYAGKDADENSDMALVMDAKKSITGKKNTVDCYTMEVAGKKVTGSLRKATFSNGDYVQVVGIRDQQNQEAFHAVAVTNPQKRMIWIVPYAGRGTGATAFIWQCAAIMSVIAQAILFTAFDLTWIACFIYPPLSALSIVYMWFASKDFAKETSSIAHALGLPHPEKINFYDLTIKAKRAGRAELPFAGIFYY